MAPSLTMTSHDLFDVDVAGWYDRPGPVLTLWLPSPSAVEGAPEHLRQHAKSVLDGLGDTAPPAAVAAVTEALADDDRAHAAGESLVVLADADGTVALVGLPDEVPTGRGWVGALPRLGPILEARQHVVPHVVVVADRVGADLVAVGATGESDAESVDGSSLHIHKGQPGGWSQRRFQQRAENRWDHNAAAVADEVDALRAAVGARVVIATGDVRALQLLGEHAPPALAEVLVVHDGPGRSDADAMAAIQPEVDRQVATVVATDTKEVMEHFDEVRHKDRAADGPEAVLAVLSEARADVLLVHDYMDDDREAVIDRASGQVGLDAEALRSLGLEPVPARLVDAALWAARHTGASVRFVAGHGPHAPEGRLGALLRG